MAIVTIISDWNRNDYYLASLKGRILGNCPGTNIIDITHQITPFNSAQAAFVLRNCFRNFPEGTVHLICVNSESTKEKPHVAVKALNHYFIGCNNGIFGLIFDDEPEEAVILHQDKIQTESFPELSVFADIACNIIKNNRLQQLGTPVKSLLKQIPMLPTIDESVINGSVIYIDSYRNAITNITQELFDKIAKGRRFEMYIQSNYYKINRINKKYNESSTGELLALFNSSGLLEIAINSGNTADLLNLNINSTVRIKFYG